MAVIAVMAAKMRLELRGGGALFATLADLALRHLRNTCRDIIVDGNDQFLDNNVRGEVRVL